MTHAKDEAVRVERWPWKSNPPRTVILRARWVPYLVAGKVNPRIAKDIAADASGIYMVRRKGRKRPLYVGESHTGRLRKRLQFHFNACGTHGAKMQRGGDEKAYRRDHCWKDPENFEVAYWTSDPTTALRDEGRAIARFAPRLNLRHLGAADDFEFGANVKANPGRRTKKARNASAVITESPCAKCKGGRSAHKRRA